MKKTVLTVICVVGMATMTYAQQEELKSATANIEKKDYIAALDDLTKAKKKVNDLMNAQISDVLPAKFGEFAMSNDAMNYGMEGQGLSFSKTYRKPVEEASNESDRGMDATTMMAIQPAEIRVLITTNMMMASEVMNAHSMADQGMANAGTEAIRVKGYRALVKLRSNEGMGMPGVDQVKTEEAHAIVGGAFVQVTAQGLEEGQAKAFLELIDFEKLVGLVGK
ncbi:MAG: hypothetical protein RL266_2524 [Bacteroidota bacterium]|jgi:hypothetical protein